MSVAWCIRVHSSAVERRIADPEVAGSIPVAPLSFVFLFYFTHLSHLRLHVRWISGA